MTIMKRNESVAVIGSGLSAIGAIKALVASGIVPTVIDYGEKIDTATSELVTKLSKINPDKWDKKDLNTITKNQTNSQFTGIPKKLVFGSDYFYGKSITNLPVNETGEIPPFSFAEGGLSAGWGAAVLPPKSCDLEDWPIKEKELNKFHKMVLSDLPYSACDDQLSNVFQLFKNKPIPLKISKASELIIDRIKKQKVNKNEQILLGQARMLINAELCKYYGYSMSGCVYGSIYKTSDEIKKFIENKNIIYVNNCIVDKLEEKNGKVKIYYYDKKNKLHNKEFDRVFLAAGATNSSRIVLNSLKKFNHKVKLKTRGGYVVPVFSFKKIPSQWPNCNTHPEIFIEMNSSKIKNWVHIQISTENELIRDRLGVIRGKKGIFQSIKKFIINHTFIAFINLHSNYAGYYELSISESNKKNYSNILFTNHIKKHAPIKLIINIFLILSKIFLKIGAFPMFFFAKLNSGAYHVGGTLPMKSERKEALDSDEYGRVGSWNKIHVIDSSIFPSLPGTTIGLLLMSNAYRIVHGLLKEKDND